MKKTSEWVSPAHPDRLADCIAAKLIDAIIEKDGFNSHAAIEVFITGNHIIVGGEATTTLPLTPIGIDPYIREVLVDIGYNSFLRSKGFTENQVYISHDYKIESYVSRQSPDIANGVGINKGFNDNGIFFGYAENSNPMYLGLAHAIASYIGENFYIESLKQESIFGPDLKTLVTVDDTGVVTDITISIPTVPKITLEKAREEVVSLLYSFVEGVSWIHLSDNLSIIVNGTGKYSIHGTLGDSGLCLAEGTLVTSNKGFRKIEYLKVGDTVITPTGKAKIIETRDNGIKPVFVIKDDRGTVIKATGNHPFRVWNGEEFIWKEAKDIQIGDTLVKSYLNGVMDTFNGKKVISFTYGRDKKECSIKLDVDFAYLLGWLTGDGCVTAEDRITFYVNPESSERDLLKSKLYRVFGEEVVKDYPCSPDRFIICSSSLRKELLDLGVLYQRGPEKTIPEIVLENTDSFRASYLRGLFDSDGYMGKRNPTLTSSSSALLQQVQVLLSWRGIQSSIHFGISKEHYKCMGEFIKDSTRYDLIIGGTVSIEKFRRFIGFDIDYKLEKLKAVKLSREFDDNRSFKVSSILKRLLDKDTYRTYRYNLRKFGDKQAIDTNRLISVEKLSYILDLFEIYSDDEDYKLLRDIVNNYTFTTVESIDKEEAHTYDISLDDDTHAFLANTFVVHNTGRKIVVNHTGGYSPNGGGSQIKGFTASDSLLNFASRWIAKSIVVAGKAHSCTVALSCAIGQKKLQSFSVLLDGKEPEVDLLERINQIIRSIEFSPEYFNRLWNCYYNHRFYNIVKSNFYGKDQDWEKDLLVF